MPTNNLDQYFMTKALQQARRAFLCDEVPVGAIIVKNEKIIARSFNLRESKQSPIAHAEIIAIERAAKKLKTWRLTDCTLYVTLEPCVMCAGAIVLARIPRVVYAAPDPKAGACGSIMDILHDPLLNHHPEVIAGICAQESGELIKSFFRRIRRQSRKVKK